MHPALSVIFFTVTSGAGFGLYSLTAVLQLFRLGPSLDRTQLLVALVTSLVLIIAGLLSSTGHLANPKNAWRSFMRVKTSWLSREAVLAVAFFPFAFLYLIGVIFYGAHVPIFFVTMGLIGIIFGFITVFATGMIYACLKTMRQWNTPLVPANYLLMGLTLGALIHMAIEAYFGADLQFISGVAGTALVMTGVMKGIYYFWIDRVSGPTINTATTFTRARVRLLDTGHTAGTFLTEEFGYQISEGLRSVLRTLVFVLGFILPLILVALAAYLAPGAGAFALAVTAVVSSYVGKMIERWLFFAEARHVVNLYHGAQHT
ncbi:dimethyl sulfoxide reductase anchor subunit family protein [Acidihalobacter ferrooxydans]|uniref:DMSO reductase n=1 Tax=Acidihalobacter ferrooxydans TaxID=1765967 RepID=A0A1P8UK92_9GAMM|nr:DmsC/YnfH family molybdoenzyme membrane anchor subunit [Acidihalobacter ferrooxydans]APZ44247.1 DMSO reductase [Acidihalobacter ferrooxydans]